MRDAWGARDAAYVVGRRGKPATNMGSQSTNQQGHGKKRRRKKKKKKTMRRMRGGARPRDELRGGKPVASSSSLCRQLYNTVCMRAMVSVKELTLI